MNLKKMAGESQVDITSILQAAKDGDAGATHRLFTVVYKELKKIAKNRISGGDHWATQTTALVHEAYLRLVKSDDMSWENRHHFFWAAARAMRDILVERARYHAAAKRGGQHKRQQLDDQAEIECHSADLVDLNEALERLAAIHPVAAQVVELRYFAGLGRQDIAELLNMSPSAVWRKWSFARAWLADDLSHG